MLFNSYIFIFAFLPAALLVFFLLSKYASQRAALCSLIAASLIFYAWWNPVYVWLIVGLIAFNYAAGHALIHRRGQFSPRLVLFLGLACNLGILVYFKYGNFFFHFHKVLLPLGISFFIFQKIAYLVDAAQGKIKKQDLLHYSLFVVFFPQLIAGPIVHFKEVVPQFNNKNTFRFNPANFAVGFTIFFIGLAKKVFIADQAAKFANPVFTLVSQGHALTFFEAWGAALAYTFQIYFDFSGYSDMAIGLARLFGVRLPLNFHSPYKAVNIIDFWRRWHMTLSRFLRDYVYIPLGGNRLGARRRYVNILLTMFLGGLWHGAGWTFILWGLLHGVYLCFNHAWHALREKTGMGRSPTRVGQWAGRVTTFLAVVAAWVLFRSQDLRGCVAMFKGMLGMNGIVLWDTYQAKLNKFAGLGDALGRMGVQYGAVDFFQKKEAIVLLVLLAAVWALPNTQQIMARYRPALVVYTKEAAQKLWWQWRPSAAWAWALVCLTVLTVSGYMAQVSEFLYFNF